MLYMVIERFKDAPAIYQRFREKGRMMPEGLNYINSWINEPVTTCYQVMETDSVEKIHEWINHWFDLADFEIVPVISSPEAKEKIFAD